MKNVDNLGINTIYLKRPIIIITAYREVSLTNGIIINNRSYFY